MQLLLVSLLIVNAILPAYSDSSNLSWEEWKQKHGKVYLNPTEEIFRFHAWKDKLEMVEKHNDDYRRGIHSFEIEMNMFADLEYHERSKIPASTDVNIQNHIVSAKKLPENVDWRKKGVVTNMTNQGQLGASGPYSAVGSLEAQQALKSGHLVPLSVQNLVDCVDAPWNVEACFEYIIKNDGIDTEASYPIRATGPGKCEFNPQTVGATMKSYRIIPGGDEAALQEVVATVGPVSVTIDASLPSFQMYKSGVYSSPDCSSVFVDHSVLVVGYGVENGVDYWLVKNSWGIYWGIDGYIKMSRNNHNNCGIASRAIFPIV